MSRDAAGRGPTVAFACDRCGRAIFAPVEDGPIDVARCPGCGQEQPLRPAPQAGRLERCLCCGLDRLYVQKDFNRKLGLGIFALAALLSVPTWGLSLLAATILDAALYRLLPDVTVCYGCGAQHRGFRKSAAHGAFDLHVAESVAARARAVVIPESEQVRG